MCCTSSPHGPRAWDQWVQLEELCARDVVRLADLKEAAVKCGIATEELESALNFLHVSGSVLYYGTHHGVGDGGVLRETVFTHPSWIVDAVKCFIHEPDAMEQNDLFRAMITEIEATDGDDLEQYHKTGRLPYSLLCRFWECFAAKSSDTRDPKFVQNHAALISLFCPLQLMTVHEDRKSARSEDLDVERSYVVPAMFPPVELRTELVNSLWLPPKARGAETFMRRQYKGIGYVPTAFWASYKSRGHAM